MSTKEDRENDQWLDERTECGGGCGHSAARCQCDVPTITVTGKDTTTKEQQ